MSFFACQVFEIIGDRERPELEFWPLIKKILSIIFNARKIHLDSLHFTEKAPPEAQKKQGKIRNKEFFISKP